MKKIVIGILGFVMFFVGCADKNTDIQSSTTKENIEKVLLSKEKWKIHSYKINGATKVLAFDKENEFFIGFKDEQVFGVAGCNNFFGAYEIKGNEIKFVNVGMTRKMCEPKMMEIESDLTQNLLNNTNRFEILEDGKILVFSEKFYLLIQ